MPKLAPAKIPTIYGIERFCLISNVYEIKLDTLLCHCAIFKPYCYLPRNGNLFLFKKEMETSFETAQTCLITRVSVKGITFCITFIGFKNRSYFPSNSKHFGRSTSYHRNTTLTYNIKKMFSLEPN